MWQKLWHFWLEQEKSLIFKTLKRNGYKKYQKLSKNHQILVKKKKILLKNQILFWLFSQKFNIKIHVFLRAFIWNHPYQSSQSSYRASSPREIYASATDPQWPCSIRHCSVTTLKTNIFQSFPKNVIISLSCARDYEYFKCMIKLH